MIGVIVWAGVVAGLPLPESSGRDWVVAPDGDDRNPGTVLKPWRTLSKAAEVVEPGDTVFVRQGEYAAGVIFRKSGAPDRLRAEQSSTQRKEPWNPQSSRSMIRIQTTGASPFRRA